MIKNKKSGQLIVISAPSGAGKDTVVKELMKRNGDNLWVSVSATSREPREGEKEGVDYYYLTKEEFEKKIEEGFFLEYTVHVVICKFILTAENNSSIILTKKSIYCSNNGI